MYRRELNYWDLQQRGIGDVERYPVSEALASIEGQQLLGSAFDELAKRQQELLQQRNVAKHLENSAHRHIYRFKNYTTSIKPTEMFSALNLLRQRRAHHQIVLLQVQPSLVLKQLQEMIGASKAVL